ncbi:DNA-binding protein [Thiocystis violacea]|uniref:DNA-binding protein n=1 Tax=Thiocystis violacea TaxID=13725 RepID=UPI001903D5AC|nr:DNA-binding protein [Thiocystis violacea]MBK1720049.1 hypothetical protein [Thiocystis violacea]
MSAHGDTRRRAYAAACALAAAGERPSVAAVRARLEGQGGQQAIQAGLNDWIQEAARRFQIPTLPEALQDAVATLWQLACQTARDQWDGERESLTAQLADGARSRLALEQEHQAAQVAFAQGQTQWAATRSELIAQQQQTQVAASHIEALERQLSEAREQLDAVTPRQAALGERLAALEDALEQARTEQGQWQERAARAEAAVARLEPAAANMARYHEHLEETCREARGLQATHQQELAERDARLQTLTGLLERTQAAYDAESARWLVQIDDQRQALAAANARERRLDQERTALWNEVQSLTYALRARQEERDASRGDPPG